MSTELAKRNTTDIVREGPFDLTPRTLNEALQLADLMSKSNLVPQQFRDRPGDILIAVQYGAELGLKPIQSLSGIAVINGRACIWGDALLGIVLASGMLENYKEMTLDEIEAAGKAVFWAKRRGTDEPIVREFSVENARKAGLWGKTGPWSQYPYRMLQMRARSWGLRDGFADVLKGVSLREEVEDIPAAQAPKVLAMPRRASEKRIEAPAVQVEPTPQIESTGEPAFDPPSHDPIDVPDDGPAVCGKCGSPSKHHAEGKWGPWWSCSTYPSCDWKISEKKWKSEQHQIGD